MALYKVLNKATGAVRIVDSPNGIIPISNDEQILWDETEYPDKEEVKEGLKYDTEKPRYDLISPIALEELAKIYTYGAKKYADHNWRKGIKWSRIFAALMRHAWAYWRGEDIDPESGHPHMASVMWAASTLLEYAQTHPELDDRYRGES